MRIKKINAALGLFAICLLIAHVAYELWSYIKFYYNPVMTKVFGFATAGVCVLHVILSAVIVFKMHDGSRLRTYPKVNIRTILQRASGCGILVCLPVHIFTGGLIAGHAGGPGLLTLLIAVQLLFWVMVFTHISVSFTRALITLGAVQSRRAQRIIDVIVWCVCGAGFIAASLVVIRVQMYLFYS